MLTDNEIMLRIIGGDTDKIGLLYEKYSGLLLGYFFKLTRDRELSEDLVNDVFLKILHSKNNYRGDGIFRVWMFRIAHSIFVNNYHKSKRTNPKEVFANVSEYEGETPETLHEREENRQMIHQALLKLKKKEREVIVLSKLEGLKYKEVAEILQCTEEAAKIRAFRALKNLKSILQKTKN